MGGEDSIVDLRRKQQIEHVWVKQGATTFFATTESSVEQVRKQSTSSLVCILYGTCGQYGALLLTDEHSLHLR